MTTTLVPPRQPAGGPAVPPSRAETAPPGRLPRLVRGRPADPPWARPALLLLLAGTALLYLWGLGASGTANSFYAAAVQAGTQSWKAMFFGSLDPGNAITVDKPAFFLWPMEIAGRIFGFNSWSMLVPQALEGVAAVGLLAATVRRISGPVAGLVAGAALAITPVAALMFRFNNPDAMLTLLLVTAGYTLIRALQAASTRWLTLTGALVGLGFITKMGQALLVVPALAFAYLIAAPTSLRRRMVQLLGAGIAMVASAGWYIAIVDIWPASSRPYIGGSTNNSLLQLALGYNGLGRLFGSGSGNGGGGAGGAGSAFGGATGLTRLFTSTMGTEISWLLPAALLALPVGLWLARRAPRTDLRRAALVLFGGWLVLTGLVFSYMQGTIHPYYTIALAPAIAGVLAVTGQLLWQTGATFLSRSAAALLVAVTAAWDTHLLAATPTFLPELHYLLLAGGGIAAAGLLAGPRLRKGTVVILAAACFAGLAGSAAYAVDTASQPHSGSIPSSGPVTSRIGGGNAPSGVGFGATPPTGTRPTGTAASGTSPTGSATTGSPPAPRSSSSTGSTVGTSTQAGRSEQVSAAVVTMLKATNTRWAAATVGAQSAAPLQLASDKAVMSIGGFNGGDNAPTLAQFKAYVAAGSIRYFVAGGSGGGPGGGSGSGAAITSWVKAHFTATTVGGMTLYDLTKAIGS
jgi:4-amino-4-deoxy-L-arabinose transferase-like glycosyltransferase